MIRFIKRILVGFISKILGPKHDWKYIYTEYKNTFLGEETSTYYKRYRICQKCGCAAEFEASIANGIYWIPLNKQERIILSKKIIDKGDYYLLDRNKKIPEGDKTWLIS